MDEVGRRFECEDYFVPELLLSAHALKAAFEHLRLLLTVRGDLRDIGRNIVSAMLEGGGTEVTDLGADVSPERFVEAVQTRQPALVCLSALLTVTMPSRRNTRQALEAPGVLNRVNALVGGWCISLREVRAA